MVTVWLAVIGLVGQSPDELKRSLFDDTSRAVRRAQSAQEYFERQRRSKLPVSTAGAGRCDEHIGRFCYWYDDGDTTLPAELEPLKASRARLLETFASAMADRPGSDWLVGERVRYLIEHGLTDSAVVIATRCGATAWWCDALTGMALHASERFAAADSAFRLGLTRMPEALRCDWTDWTLVLDGKLADRFHDLDCAGRQALADTVFWLSQPLLTRPGNDLRTELMSRRVMSWLHSVAKSPHLMSWGKDMEEMMLRYGWEVRYSVSDPGYRPLDEQSVVGHERSPAYQFFPVVKDDSTVRTWSWDLKPARSRSRYSPSYASHFTESKRFRIARFPRGDSTVVVGWVVPDADTVLAGRPLSIAMAAGSGPSRMAVARRDSTTEVAILLTAAGNPLVASLEASPSDGHRFVRTRILFPRAVPHSLDLSDPLLFKAGDDLPTDLTEALKRALPDGRIARSSVLGVYWEVSGVGADSVAVAVSVRPIRRGLLGRIAQGLRVVKQQAPVTLQWQSPTERAPVVRRSFELDLSHLKPGKYLLHIDVSRGDAAAATETTLELIP